MRSGDTLSSIARRFDLEERALLRVNNIDHPDLILLGQRLVFPGSDALTSQPVVYVTPEEPVAAPAVVVQPAAPAPAPLTIQEDPTPPVNETVATDVQARAADDEFAIALDPAQNVEANNAQAIVDLAADPSDYSVADNASIEVQASDTLGHYAEWLSLDTLDLRRLNRMSANQPVVFGKRLTLDFSKVSVAEFELKRREFHLREQQDFFRNYRIQNVAEHTVAPNDNIARLARSKYSVPMWLLRQYNPQLDFRQVQIGQKVVFPVLEAVAVPAGSS